MVDALLIVTAAGFALTISSVIWGLNRIVKHAGSLSQDLSGRLESIATEQSKNAKESNALLEETSKAHAAQLGQLETATNELRLVLGTIQDFDGLREWSKTLKDSSEPLNNVVHQIEQSQATNGTLIQETATMLQQWSEQHVRVEKLYEQASKQLSEWATEHTLVAREDSEALRNALSEISKNQELTRRTVERFGELIEQDTQVRESLQSDLPTVVSGLNKLEEQLQTLLNTQNEANTRLGKIGKPMEAAAARVGEQAQATLDVVQKQAERQAEANRKTLANIENAVKGIDSGAERFTQELKRMQTLEWVKTIGIVAGVVVGIIFLTSL